MALVAARLSVKGEVTWVSTVCAVPHSDSLGARNITEKLERADIQPQDHHLDGVVEPVAARGADLDHHRAYRSAGEKMATFFRNARPAASPSRTTFGVVARVRQPPSRSHPVDGSNPSSSVA
jgi:hypothetical protein